MFNRTAKAVCMDRFSGTTPLAATLKNTLPLKRTALAVAFELHFFNIIVPLKRYVSTALAVRPFFSFSSFSPCLLLQLFFWSFCSSCHFHLRPCTLSLLSQP